MKASFKNISPRLMGYIAGFMYLMAMITGFIDEASYMMESYQAEYSGILTEYFDHSFDMSNVIVLFVDLIIGVIVAIGLLTCNHKTLIAGITCTIVSLGVYVFDLFTADYVDYFSLALNASSMVVSLLIILSIVVFSKKISIITVIITAVVKLCVPIYLFLSTVSGYYFEFSTDYLTSVLTLIDVVAFDYAIAYIFIALYVYVLITYEGEEKHFNENAEKCDAYSNIANHIFLCVLFGSIWYFIWVYHTTKAINEISKDEKKRSPKTEVFLNFIPFYSLYWTYKQLCRLERELKAVGAEEKGMGTVGVALGVIESSITASIYMQYKINEYCMMNANKLTKKEKYNDYYDENEGITIDYPTDTTEKKPTEIFLDEGQWKECESE